MLDLAVCPRSVAFFALMLAYVRACEALGHDSDHVEERDPMSAENWIGGLISVGPVRLSVLHHAPPGEVLT